MTSCAQLSLFNVAQTVATSYKVGDWVKLRKKPFAASYVKKGDILQVAAIHPLDGSIKFWNERSERWEFVQPEEIDRVVDSVTPVEPAVTESNFLGDGEYLALNAVSTYRPRGTARGGEYYRLSYKDGSRVRHVHIRGGNTDSPIAQAKVKEVRSLLAAGMSPKEVAALLKTPASFKLSC